MSSEQHQPPSRLERTLNAVYSCVAHINHAYIWPAIAHTFGLRVLHKLDMARRLDIQSGEHILELGGGDIPYYTLLGFTDRVGQEGRYVIVDIDSTVNKRAHHAIARREISLTRRGKPLQSAPPEVVTANATHLPHEDFPDGSFDKVIATQLDYPGYQSEAFRVLKPGGRMLESFQEPLVPVFIFAKMAALRKAGFVDIHLTPSTPTLPLPLNNIGLPPLPFLNWVVSARKPQQV